MEKRQTQSTGSEYQESIDYYLKQEEKAAKGRPRNTINGFFDERSLTKAEDKLEQEVILEILLKMRQKDSSLTLVDCVVMLCEHLGLETDEFYRNCGSIVQEKIKQDAIQNRLVPTKGLQENSSLDDFF